MMAGSKLPCCQCPDRECARHGLCAACRAHHRSAGTPPKCERQQQDPAFLSVPQDTTETEGSGGVPAP